MALMEDITNEIYIIDGAFILNQKKENEKLINLISCSKIQKNKKKGSLKITCLVEEEAKDGSFTLKLGKGKKIDNIEPLVSGDIIFSQDGPTHEDLSIDDDSTSSNQTNSSNNSKILKIFSIIMLLLSF